MRPIAAGVASALEVRARLGAPGATVSAPLASGRGWSVDDVVCNRGPTDVRFGEQHESVSISLVLAGTFQYRSGAGEATLTPGSLLLANDGERFECGHEHGAGDRCLAFRYAPERFESIVEDLGAKSRSRPFGRCRLPPLRELARLSALAECGVLGVPRVAWEELSLEVAVAALGVMDGAGESLAPPSRRAVSRVTDTVREIERTPAAPHTLESLSAAACLSPYHYLRTFKRVTGVTPHQLILRTRLREAATRVALERTRVIDVAFGTGFGDLSNFNRAFRNEFGVSPLGWRQDVFPRGS